MDQELPEVKYFDTVLVSLQMLGSTFLAAANDVVIAVAANFLRRPIIRCCAVRILPVSSKKITCIAFVTMSMNMLGYVKVPVSRFSGAGM
jgi:hypothetical protein